MYNLSSNLLTSEGCKIIGQGQAPLRHGGARAGGGSPPRGQLHEG